MGVPKEELEKKLKVELEATHLVSVKKNGRMRIFDVCTHDTDIVTAHDD